VFVPILCFLGAPLLNFLQPPKLLNQRHEFGGRDAQFIKLHVPSLLRTRTIQMTDECERDLRTRIRLGALEA
jgi:hypothetical protein